MATISENGIPNKFTKGSIGDMYIDLETGKQYTCVMSYRSSVSKKFEYKWEERKNTVSSTQKMRFHVGDSVLAVTYDDET